MGRINSFFYTSERNGVTACFWTRSRWELSAEKKVAKAGSPDFVRWVGGRLDEESLKMVEEKFEPDYLYVTENANV